jgi:glucose/arabinose dehydrogenase
LTTRRRSINAGLVINVAIITLGLVGIAILLVGQALEGEDEAAGPLDLRLELSSVTSGLESPVFLTGAGDASGFRYVVEQRGLIRTLATDGSVEPAPFLDIRDRVLHHHERGLLGLAFHPDYAQNGRFFVLYSRGDGDGATSVSQFTVDGHGRVEDTELALLVIPSFSTMHKGGMLAFDDEGMLLAGIGDGSTGNDPEGAGQDRASLLASLLRLDVDRGFPYAIPLDNGFAHDPQARGEIHAIGLRNPWRFSVDQETGHVYIGDVGQSDWEEIDVLAPGTREPSFGWSVMEGADCFYGRPCDPTAHIAPVIAYPHVDGEVGHCSVIGGYVYRGEAGSLPAGAYLYADYCSGTVWGVPVEQLRAGQARPVIVGQVPGELGQVQSFGSDDAGELYLLTDAGNVLGLSAAAS